MRPTARPIDQQIVLTMLCVACPAPAGFAGNNRPQTPAPPFPYVSQDVTFDSHDGTATLAGTLTLPKAGGPFAAACLVPGATPFDRDETIAGHKPFLVLSDHLTRKGFAVLRVDDRGVGKSTGNKFAASLSDLAKDAIACVSFLKTQPNIDDKRVGLIGHSFGAILAPIAAAESDDVGFVVMLAGTGQSWMDFLAASHALHDEGTVQVNRKLASVMNKMLRAVDGDAVRIKDVRARWETFIPTLPHNEQPHAKKFMNALEGINMFLSVRPLRDMLAHDPAATLSRVKCPVLAVAGDRDPMAITLSSIASALKAGGHKDHVVRKLPKLNHMFQTVELADYEDGPGHWGRIGETLSPVALDIISTWLSDRFIEQ